MIKTPITVTATTLLHYQTPKFQKQEQLNPKPSNHNKNITLIKNPNTKSHFHNIFSSSNTRSNQIHQQFSRFNSIIKVFTLKSLKKLKTNTQIHEINQSTSSNTKCIYLTEITNNRIIILFVQALKQVPNFNCDSLSFWRLIHGWRKTDRWLFDQLMFDCSMCSMKLRFWVQLTVWIGIFVWAKCGVIEWSLTCVYISNDLVHANLTYLMLWHFCSL